MLRKAGIIAVSVLVAGMAFGLRALDYHYTLRDINLEVYVGGVATLFLVFGLWLGNRLIKKQPPEATSQAVTTGTTQSLSVNAELGTEKGLTGRELEVLQLIAQGLSNQEIADRLFVSLNTVKTHSSNLFLKLDVKRRTQAVQKAKEMNLIA